MQETPVRFQGREKPLEKGIHWRKDRLPIPVFLGFPCGSTGKESACNEGDLGSIPGLGRYSGEGKGYPLQDSGLENSMDCTVHGVAKSWTQLSDFHFHPFIPLSSITIISAITITFSALSPTMSFAFYLTNVCEDRHCIRCHGK